MDHDHDTERSRRQSPRVLVDISLFVFTRTSLVGVFNGNVKHLGEVLTEVVGRSSLDTTTGCRDESLDSGGVVSSGEFLLDGLDTWNDGDGE